MAAQGGAGTEGVGVRVSSSWKKNPCLFPESLIDRLETRMCVHTKDGSPE